MPATTHTVIAAAGLALLAVPHSGCARTPASQPARPPSAQAAPAPPAKTIGEQGPLVGLIPGLPSAPAPSFVRLGLRLSYRVHTATVAGMGKDWRPDENGAWQTEDGQRWTPFDKGANAAEGIMQFEVVSLTPREAAVLATFYLIPRPGAPPQMSFHYPIVGPASSTGGLWVAPDKLRTLANRVTPNLKVQRMPCAVGTGTRPAVWVQTLHANGNRMYAYDEATGVLLHDASSGTGPPSRVIGPLETSNTPSTTLADGTLVGQRGVSRPWDAERPDAWAGSAGTLVYTGTSTVPTAGGAPLTLRQDMSVTPKDRGAGWVLYNTLLRTTNTLGMPPVTSPGETICGLGQFGGAWLPPTVLTSLAKGRELDDDPHTGVRVTVDAADGSRVVIAARNGAQGLRWTYDATTGIMVGIEKEDPTPLGRIRTRLTLQRR